MNKNCIKDLDFQETKELFLSLREKEYKARQLFNWLYERNVESFHDMSDLSKSLRRSLDESFVLSPLSVEERKISAIDATEKYLFRTMDGNFIESVLIKNDGTEDGRITVCVSSQIGCAMGCVFCRTGNAGFTRNLTPGEIVDQICQIRRASGLRNNNVVFMGMGEPFNNYENVLKASDIMNYSFGFHISVRKITISTSGIIPGIERFIDEKRMYNLAISLNDTLSEKRSVYMPVDRKYPISEICALLDRKHPCSRNRVTIEYVMRKDNISTDDAKRLKRMFRNSRIKLNLIPLNCGEHGLQPPDEGEVRRFIDDLMIMNIPVSVRNSLGSDICGACGQLSGCRYREAG